MRALLLLLLLPDLSLAQSSRFVERDLEDRLPDRFRVDISALREEIHARIPKRADAEEREQRRDLMFADKQAYYIAQRLSSGFVYGDWPELEDLVNKVMRRVIPPGLADAEKVRAYVVRDPSVNASMSSAGYMFIDLGMMCELPSEAALAALLCHEVAHYHLQHGYDAFRHEHDGDLAESKRSVRMETQADSLALAWLLASDYALIGMEELLATTARIEQQWERMMGAKVKDGRPTHPATVERQETFNTFLAAHKEEPGAPYLETTESGFDLLRAACVPELLRVLLQGQDYEECIRKAFNAHIKEPNDPLFVWYLMEAMRRMCYLDEDRWDKLFIMDEFYATVADDITRGGVKSSKHMFIAFDPVVICMDTRQMQRIQAKFYWKEGLKFRTYREAYDFFERLSALLDCRECILSSAMLNYSTAGVRDSLLGRYVAAQGRFSAFAQDMLDGRVSTGMNSGKLLVFTWLHGYIRQGKEDIPVRVNNGEVGAQLQRLMDSLVIALPNRRVVPLLAQRDSSMEYYRQLTELRWFSAYPTFARGERTELHMIDPRYYELFRQAQVNEIEFVRAEYWDIGKRERSSAAYAEAALTDHTTIFDGTKGERYLRVYVSSLRDMPRSPMKSRYFDGEYAMKNGRSGIGELVKQIKHTLHAKELRMKDIAIFGYR